MSLFVQSSKASQPIESIVQTPQLGVRMVQLCYPTPLPITRVNSSNWVRQGRVSALPPSLYPWQSVVPLLVTFPAIIKAFNVTGTLEWHSNLFPLEQRWQSCSNKLIDSFNCFCRKISSRANVRDDQYIPTTENQNVTCFLANKY